MTVQENKATIRRYYQEFWEDGNLEAASEFWTPEVVLHTIASFSQDRHGIDEVRQSAATARAALSDMHFTIEDLFAEDDRVVVRYSARGKHLGELNGVAPTGKEIEWPGVGIFRLEGGRIAEMWSAIDTMGMMQQVGAIPTPEPAAA